MKQLISLLIIVKFFTSCGTKIPIQDFSVKIKHFYGAEGYTCIYYVNQDSLRISSSCDFTNCEDTTLYKIALKKESVSEFYNYINDFDYEGLKDVYEPEEIISYGHDVFVEIIGDSIPNKNINLFNYDLNEIKELIEEVDLLIPNKKYKFYN
ncbi:MAG: hypothetical protein ABFR05_06785 [Bacteroidota bacterium]